MDERTTDERIERLNDDIEELERQMLALHDELDELMRGPDPASIAEDRAEARLAHEQHRIDQMECASEPRGER